MNDMIGLLDSHDFIGLKSKAISEQIAVVESLSQELLDEYTRIQSVLEDTIGGVVLRVTFTGERVQLVQLAILALVAADIATVPVQATRSAYYRRLHETAGHFGIEKQDLDLMLTPSTVIQLESILRGR
jgi:hypothetical protein